MAETIDLFKTLGTMRSMRRLKPDPVPDELIHKIINAGLGAPSGGDVQHWRFFVVKDAEIKQQIQHYYKKALDTLLPRYRSSRPPPGKTQEQKRSSIYYISQHLNRLHLLFSYF